METHTGIVGLLLALTVVVGGGIACAVVAFTVPGAGSALIGTMAAACLTPAVLHEA